MHARQCQAASGDCLRFFFGFFGMFGPFLELPNVFLLFIHLGGGNSNIFGIFTPNLGEDEPILTSIFFRWVVQPPTSSFSCIF